MKFETGYPNPFAPKKSSKKGVLHWVAESRLAKAALLAGALHAPLKKEVGEALEHAGHAVVEAVQSPWEKQDMVIHMQTKEEQGALKKRVAMREANADVQGGAAYKAQAENLLETGQDMPFGRSYFDLARLNGKSPEEVDHAEKAAQKLIEKYSEEFGDDLEEAELRKMSIEMYGPNESYDPGQGSATDYFNKGERNCAGVNRAQLIVLEGVLAKLPAAHRSHWQSAVHLENQHEATALARLGADGKRDVLYILEGKSTRALRGADESGTANTPIFVIKKSMVSSKPVDIQAAGKPGEVKKPTRLDLVTDEEVPFNINLQGTFRNAQFNIDEAKREGIEPRKMTEQELVAETALEASERILEFDLLTDPGPEGARAIMQRDLSKPLAIYSEYDPQRLIGEETNAVNARELTSPSVETVKVFSERVETSHDPSVFDVSISQSIHYGDMSQWPPESIDQAFKNGTQRISVQVMPDGSISKTLLERLAHVDPAQKIRTDELKFEVKSAGEVDGPQFRQLPEGQLRELLSTNAVKTIDLSSMYGDPGKSDIEDIVQRLGRGHLLKMSGSHLSAGHAEYLARSEGVVRISPDAYARLITQSPKLLGMNKHISFNPDGASIQSLSAVARAIDQIDSKHPLHKELREMIQATNPIFDGDGEVF